MPSGGGFRYPFDVRTAMEGFRTRLSKDSEVAGPDPDVERTLALLEDRDRALEDFTSIVPVFAFDASNITFNTAGPNALGPSVTVKLPRGVCYIHVGAYTTCTATNQTAYGDIYMDGAFLQTGFQLGNNSGGSLGVSISSVAYFDNLEPGTHTFEIRYGNTLVGTNVMFDGRFILVTPII